MAKTTVHKTTLAGAVGQNNRRADWAHVAINAFAQEVGTKLLRDGPEVVVGDLLCDLMHWCDEEEVNFKELLARGKRHYREETSGKCRMCRRRFDVDDPYARGKTCCPECASS